MIEECFTWKPLLHRPMTLAKISHNFVCGKDTFRNHVVYCNFSIFFKLVKCPGFGFTLLLFITIIYSPFVCFFPIAWCIPFFQRLFLLCPLVSMLVQWGDAFQYNFLSRSTLCLYVYRTVFFYCRVNVFVLFTLMKACTEALYT